MKKPHFKLTGITIYMTQKCNFKCSYCFEAGRLAKAAEPEVGMRALDFLFENADFEQEYLTCTFFGGEPLLEYKQMRRLVEYGNELAEAHSIPLLFNVVTNGSLLDDKVIAYLVDNNFVDCIIQLPSNLFFGTSIATCIMVMKRGKQDNRILFIDATNQCVKVTNNNKLLPEHIDTIVDAFSKREDVEYLCRLVDYDEVKEQNYNLSVSTYVEPEDTREKIDIVKLNAEIKEIVAREQVLRNEIDKIIVEIEGGQYA